MHIIPAIDLLDGLCVRLRQGDFDRVQVYEQTALQLAERYYHADIEWLHVVDLAASRDGEHADTGAMFELLSTTRQKVQTGGGVRTAADVEARLNAGATRVVVGSIAAETPDKFTDWIKRFGPDALVAALDIQIDAAGTPLVRSHGWKRSSGNSLWELLDLYAATNLKHLLCTDISKDGLLGGPNLGLYRQICERYPNFLVQASGGVRDVSDLSALAQTGAAAAISGKALLDGQLDPEDANQALEKIP